MHVDPALRAFARDAVQIAAAQGRVLAAKEEWAHSGRVAPVLADCARLAEGSDLVRCGALGALMAGEGAQAFVEGWICAMARAWRDAPLAQMPFRHSYSGGSGAMHLHRAGGVTLALLIVEPGAAMPPRTIAFTDCDRWELVIAGNGQGRAYDWSGAGPPEITHLVLRPGLRLACDRSRSRAIVSLDTPLVSLRVSRERPSPRPTSEVEIATGHVVHWASACPAEGRAQLSAALLGAMGRADAAPVLADYACGQADGGARWEALRQALALDTAAGFAGLNRLAEDPTDELAPVARALRDSLCTTYPQLANMCEAPCPA